MDASITKTSKFGIWALSPPERPSSTTRLNPKISPLAFFECLQSMDFEAAQRSSAIERKESTQRRQASDTTLYYGEIPFHTLEQILEQITAIHEEGYHNNVYADIDDIDINGCFVDLGSGAGRPVFAAACLHPFRSCIGIEIMSSLYASSLVTLGEYHKKLDSEADLHVLSDIREGGGSSDSDGSAMDYSSGEAGSHRPTSEVQFFHGSILDIDSECASSTESVFDWTKADVVLANSTCYKQDMVDQLSRLGRRMRRGAHFVSFSYQLDSAFFELVLSDRLCMSWGDADVFYHRRK